MPSYNKNKNKTKDNSVSYLNRDFNSLRNSLVKYAKQHYGDKIIDYGESSLAGLFVDMAAYVGDVMSYYLDHNFNELSLESAIEENNIVRHAREAGVEINGPSPAVVRIKIAMRIPATQKLDGSYEPNRLFLPIVGLGTVFSSIEGVEFTLLDNVDFAEVDENSELNFLEGTRVSKFSNNNTPLEYLVFKEGFCTSAKSTIQDISLDDQHVPFRRVTLSNGDVTEIVRVIDSEFNNFYEVKSLSQDTVFVREKNIDVDRDIVDESLRLLPAPRRYLKQRSRETGLTTLIFGAGDELFNDEDIVPDPSQHALRMFGNRKQIDVVSIDPNSLLKTSTLGISPKNTTLSIEYRYGGGLADNVDAGSIRSVKNLLTNFKTSVPSSVASRIRSSVSCINEEPALGGENELSIEDLRAVGALNQLSQNRTVSREDLIARVYSLPVNFGRVFRAAVNPNPNNAYSSHLHVISRNRNGVLVASSDTLKKNLKLFLSRHRLVGDAIDIVDARVVNIGINFVITIDITYSGEIIVQSINSRLKDYFLTRKWQIDQPIYKSDLINLMINTEGVISFISLDIYNIFGIVDDKQYSSDIHPIKRNTVKGIIYPPKGGIFEIKFPDDDIKGKIS